MGVTIPEVGRWYSGPDGSLFEVVAVDPRDSTIELQHFDGTLEESEPEGWLAKQPQPAEAPEDWTGSVDISAEDYPALRFHPALLDWQRQLDQMSQGDDPAIDLDDWH